MKAEAEIIKDYSMDALTPAVSGAGKQTFTWSAEGLFTDKTYITLLLAGTKFDLVFGPDGTATTIKNETRANYTILSCERKGGESGDLLESIIGEAESVTPPA